MQRITDKATENEAHELVDTGEFLKDLEKHWRARRINFIVSKKREGLTQSHIADLLGMQQANVSTILNKHYKEVDVPPAPDESIIRRASDYVTGISAVPEEYNDLFA